MSRITDSQMSPDARRELSGLSRRAKNELRGFVANKLTIIIGNAQLAAADDRLPALVRANARVIDRASSLFLEELEEVLGLDRNGHLGAAEES